MVWIKNGYTPKPVIGRLSTIKFLKDIILSRYALQMNTATGKTTSQNYVSIKSRLGTKHGGHTVPI